MRKVVSSKTPSVVEEDNKEPITQVHTPAPEQTEPERGTAKQLEDVMEQLLRRG